MKKKTKKTKAAEAAKPYEPTAHERAAIDAFLAARQKNPPGPSVKVEKVDGIDSLAFDHPDRSTGWVLLMAAFGSKEPAFASGIVSQLTDAGFKGQDTDPRGVNFMLSVIRGIEPKDQTETMLAAQMAAVHMATMTFARSLAHAEWIPQQDSAANAFNKLARTFAAQMEALARYRGKGEQKMTIEHVHVHAGGQAIVGTVAPSTPGGMEKSEEQPHEPRPQPALTHEPRTPLFGTEPQRETLSVASGEGEAPLPVARRG